MKTIELDEISKTVERLNELLRPDAEREIDINDPDWQEKLEQSPELADTLGLRKEIREVTDCLIRRFCESDSAGRSRVKNLLRKNDGFRYSMEASLSHDPEENFRKDLALQIMDDLGPDTRDAIVNLESLIVEAKAQGVRTQQILKEMKKKAGTTDHHGMGSMKKLLEKHC